MLLSVIERPQRPQRPRDRREDAINRETAETAETEEKTLSTPPSKISNDIMNVILSVTKNLLKADKRQR